MGFFSPSSRAQLFEAPPAEPPPLPFAAGVGASWEYAALAERSDSLDYQLHDGLEKSLIRAADLGLNPPPLPTVNTWSNRQVDAYANWLDSRKDAIAALRSDASGPPDPFLKTGEEIRAEAARRVQEARARAGRAGVGASLVGGGAALMTDLPNLAVMALVPGVGAAEGILVRSGIAFGSNVAAEVLSQVASLEAKESAGVTPTAGEALANMAIAGGGGALLGELFHGAGVVARRVAMLRDYHAKVRAGEIIPTRETEAAAAAIQDHLDTVPPLHSPQAERAHLEATAAAVDVLRADHPILEESAQRRFEEKVKTFHETMAEAPPADTSDRRIAAMSVDEWVTHRPMAETGADPTVETVLAMTGVTRDTPGPVGISRVRIAKDEGLYLFRDETGRVRGALHGFLSSDGTPELASIAVDPELQRRGLGKKLLAAARKDFPDADVEAIQRTAGLTEAGARLRYRDAIDRTTGTAAFQLESMEAELARLDTARSAAPPTTKGRRSNTLLAEIRRRGGINPESLRKWDGHANLTENGLLSVARRGARGLDQVHATAIEEGLIPEETSLDDFVQMLIDKVPTMEAGVRASEARTAAEFDAESLRAHVVEYLQARDTVRRMVGGREPLATEVDDYLQRRTDPHAVALAEMAAEESAPTARTRETQLGAGETAEEWHTEADDRANFERATESNPDIEAAYEADDGAIKVGNARESMRALNEERATLRSILDCILTPEVGA